MENGRVLVEPTETARHEGECDPLTGSKVNAKVNGKVIGEVISETEHGDRHGDERPLSTTVKVIRTLAVISAWICMGLFSEVTGPTLPTLRERIAVNYEQISRALVARGVGFLVGSLLGGMLCERYRRLVDVWMAAALGVAAFATATVPWCHSLTTLCVAFCADGTGKGVIGAGGNAFVIRLWGMQADMPIQSLHLSYGVGALIAPQLVRPFLVAVPMTSNVTYAAATTVESPNGTLNVPVASGAIFAIEYPLLMIAALTAAVGVAFVVLFVVSPMSSRGAAHRTKLRDLITPHRWLPTQRRRALGLIIILLLFIFFTLPVGAERSFGRFLFAYSVEGSNRLSAGSATMLESTFWLSFTIGRGVATGLARWVSAAILLSVELAVMVSASAALVVGAGRHHLWLWGGTAAFGAGLAPLFPTAITWAHAYIDMSGMMTSVAFVAAGVGAFTCSWLSGYFFQYVGPSSVLALTAIFSILAIVVFAALRLLASFYGNRFEQVPVDDLELKVATPEVKDTVN